MCSVFDGQYVGAGKKVSEDNLPGTKQGMTRIPAPAIWLQGDKSAQESPADMHLNSTEYMIDAWAK